MRRCADARVHGCTDKRRRCDHAERQRENLKKPSKITGFLAFSVHGRPSARSKFLGVPRANSANAREQIFESIPWLPPWGVQRRSERKLRKRAKMESEKKTNRYYKNKHRIQSFFILCVQASREKKDLGGNVNPFRMIFSTFFFKASVRARVAPKLSSQDLGHCFRI